MSYKKPTKKNKSSLPKGTNPEVFTGKASEARNSKNTVHDMLPGGDLPIMPGMSGQDQPLMAYIERLAEEAEMYFPRFAQDHIVLLRQRRYDKSGELCEIATCVYGSPSMSQEEAVDLIEGSLERVKEGFDFRLAKGDPEADPLAFMQAPATEIEETEEEEDETPDDFGV